MAVFYATEMWPYITQAKMLFIKSFALFYFIFFSEHTIFCRYLMIVNAVTAHVTGANPIKVSAVDAHDLVFTFCAGVQFT